MDIGDLIFLIFIALGGLSSLLGSKKKKTQGQSAKGPKGQPGRTGPPRPVRRQGGVRTAPERDLQEARQKVSSEMDRILQELGLGGGSSGTTAAPGPPPSTAPVEETEVSDEIEVREHIPRPRSRPLPQRELPRTVSLETFERAPTSIETLERAGGKSHERFHARYIKALPEPPDYRGPARAKQFVNPRSLREAMIMREILGTPKGLE